LVDDSIFYSVAIDWDTPHHFLTSEHVVNRFLWYRPSPWALIKQFEDIFCIL